MTSGERISIGSDASCGMAAAWPANIERKDAIMIIFECLICRFISFLVLLDLLFFLPLRDCRGDVEEKRYHDKQDCLF